MFTYIADCSVMVTAVRNGHGDPSSNPAEVVFISHSNYTIGKVMHPTVVLPSAMGK